MIPKEVKVTCFSYNRRIDPWLTESNNENLIFTSFEAAAMFVN